MIGRKSLFGEHQFENHFKFKKNEVSLVELKYSLFMCELMVDENLIMAFLEKRKPGHYVVENGFIFIAEDNLRQGSKDQNRFLRVFCGPDQKSRTIRILS